MPVNRNKIRRFQTLLSMMRRSLLTNYTTFLKEMCRQDSLGEYKLSHRTFLRDIKELQEGYHAPIEFDQVQHGYFLQNPEWYNEELMVEPFEMRSALLGERVASSILPDPMRGEITRAINALLMKNESGMAEGVELDTFQIFCPENMPRVRPDIFLTAYSAWEEHRYLRLTYRSAKNRVSEKLFEPHIFAWLAGCWYLKGRLLRDDETHYDPPMVQVLALHRIGRIELPGGTFDPAPAILKTVKESGLFDFEKIPEVRLEIRGPFAVSLADNFADKIIERGEGYIRILLKNIPEYEALQIIFSTRGNVRVLAPDPLRETVRAAARKLLENLDDTDAGR